jgi:hypothetical protein
VAQLVLGDGRESQVRPDGSPVRRAVQGVSHRQESYYYEVLRYVVLDKVWLAFGQDAKTAQAKYREFVDEKLDAPSPFAHVVGQLFLGSQSFIDTVKERIEKRGASEAYPREQREVGHASASQVGQVVCRVFAEMRDGTVRPGEAAVDLKERRVSVERILAAWLARLQGEKLQSIAGILGVTSLGHVSTLVKRCGAEIAKDRRLLELAERCRELIRELPSPAFSPHGATPAFAR